MICPHCSSEKFHKSGHLKDGTQQYKCNNCGHYFSSHTKIALPPLQCLHCGSFNTVRSGIAPNGKQRYQCKDCGKRSTEGATAKSAGTLTEKEKRTILLYHKMGLSIASLAKHLGRTEKTISKFLKRGSKLVILNKEISNGMGKRLKSV